MKSRKNTTLTHKIWTYLKEKWPSFHFLRTRKLRNTILGERKQKFLYPVEKIESQSTWKDRIHKAQRGAYFRPIYSVFRTHKAEYTVGFLIVGCLLIFLSVYIFLYSAYFRLTPNRTIIERLDEYSDINIAYKAIEPLYGQSLWLLSEREILESIRSLEKNVSRVQTTHLYPNTLRIVIESYPPVFSAFIPGNQKSYLLTQNGIIIPDRSEKNNLPRIRLYSEVLVESTFLDYKEAIP